MDVFAHGLWGSAAFSAINTKIKKPLNVRWAALFSIFPDFFAFTPMFVWMFWSFASGSLSFADMPHPDDVEPAQRDTLFIFRVTAQLYQFTHSIIIFFIVFAIVHLLLRRPVWEMGAWLLHIFIDIPTHSYEFYPTPFLWPFSGVMVDGISWGVPWFMIVNYASLAIVYFLLFYRKKKRQVLEPGVSKSE